MAFSGEIISHSKGHFWVGWIRKFFWKYYKLGNIPCKRGMKLAIGLTTALAAVIIK